MAADEAPTHPRVDRLPVHVVRRSLHQPCDRSRPAPQPSRRSPRRPLRRPRSHRWPPQHRPGPQDHPRGTRHRPVLARPRGATPARGRQCRSGHQRPPPTRRQTRRVARAWTADELATFLAAGRTHRLYPALHLTAYIGMRRGEVAGLKWSDLDISTNRLSISRTLQSLAGQPVEFPVKTRASRRCIDIDEGTIEILARWRRRLSRDGLPHGIDDWMFVNTTGRFINPESLSQLFDRLQAKMPDLTWLRFHDLRHTHASLLIMDDEKIKVVSERLGHANVAFTMQTYQHLLPGMSAAAATRFADLIARSGR